MGARSPRPEFKRRAAEQQAQDGAFVSSVSAAPSFEVLQDDDPASPAAVLSAQDRENPQKLTGEALRQLAHRRGLARSQLVTMSDEKIREQLRYITYNQYEQADALV
jgi:hypothetical protein